MDTGFGMFIWHTAAPAEVAGTLPSAVYKVASPALPAAIRAVAHLFPAARPLFAPFKRSPARGADLGRQLAFAFGSVGCRVGEFGAGHSESFADL